jgi:hypothetical protein
MNLLTAGGLGLIPELGLVIRDFWPQIQWDLSRDKQDVSPSAHFTA